MFTGLVEEQGTIVSATPVPKGTRLVVRARRVMDDLAIDHSIAVNGVCLTVVERTDETFALDVIPETLGKTTIGTLRAGDAVNLERAVRVGDRLGGHIVQGHVDVVGSVVSTDVLADGAWEMWVGFAPEYRRWLIPMGSITIDGVSLTVADVRADMLKVAIIPHTLAVTTIGQRTAGHAVNLEFDVLAKHLESLTLHRTNA